MAMPPKKPSSTARPTSKTAGRPRRRTATRDLDISAEEARRYERAFRAKANGAPDDLDDDDLDTYLDSDRADDDAAIKRAKRDAKRDAGEDYDLDEESEDESEDEDDEWSTDAEADAAGVDDDLDADDAEDEGDDLNDDDAFDSFPDHPISRAERAMVNKLYHNMPAMPKAKPLEVTGWVDLGQTRDAKTGRRLYPQFSGWMIRVRKKMPLDWVEAAQDLAQQTAAAKRRGPDAVKRMRVPVSSIRTLVARACVAWNFPDEFGEPLARPPTGVGALDEDLLVATFTTITRTLRGPKGSTRR